MNRPTVSKEYGWAVLLLLLLLWTPHARQLSCRWQTVGGVCRMSGGEIHPTIEVVKALSGRAFV